jgi:hypothetical protein
MKVFNDGKLYDVIAEAEDGDVCVEVEVKFSPTHRDRVQVWWSKDMVKPEK